MNTKESSYYKNNTCITLFQGYSSVSFFKQLSWTLSKQLKISFLCSFTFLKISAPDYGSFLNLKTFSSHKNNPQQDLPPASSFISSPQTCPSSPMNTLKNILVLQQPPKCHFLFALGFSLLSSKLSKTHLSAPTLNLPVLSLSFSSLKKKLLLLQKENTLPLISLRQPKLKNHQIKKSSLLSRFPWGPKNISRNRQWRPPLSPTSFLPRNNQTKSSLSKISAASL